MIRYIITIYCFLATLAIALAEEPFKPNTVTVGSVGIARARDFTRANAEGGIRLGFDLTSKFGGFVEASGSDFKETLVEHATVGVKLGVPYKRVRPYVVGTFGLQFPQTRELFGVGGGLDVAAWKKLRVFVEATCEVNAHEIERTSAKLTAGASWAF